VLPEIEEEFPLDRLLVEALASEIYQVLDELVFVRLVEVLDEPVEAEEELLVP